MNDELERWASLFMDLMAFAAIGIVITLAAWLHLTRTDLSNKGFSCAYPLH